MTFPHAVVWMDHREAHIIDFALDEHHEQKVRQQGGPRALHHRAGSVGSGNAKEDHAYFDAIVAALGDATEILVAGPGNAKTEFVKDAKARHAKFAERIVGTETLDHPTDPQILAFAKKYFARYDNLQGD